MNKMGVPEYEVLPTHVGAILIKNRFLYLLYVVPSLHL